MNDYIKLIIFNLVMIFLSFKFKKNIIIFYVFLMLIMLSYEMMLKNKLIEGNFQEDLFKSLDNLDNNRPQLELPIDKMSLILEKMLEKITGEEKFKKGKECKGEFVINKLTNKTCGDGFNERVYKILDRGNGDCLHSELYKEKVPLRSCEYSEKCEKDLDCESNKCNNGLCDFELGCSETMLSGCGYDSCMALNDELDKDLYYWKDSECKVNPCNENTYQMCDEGGCNDLSYRFSYDTEKKQCKEIINKQSESSKEKTSMEDTYQQYLDEGGYDNICKPNDFETCEISNDLQPRYYCKDKYYKMCPGQNGDSTHCFDLDELKGDQVEIPEEEEEESGHTFANDDDLREVVGYWLTDWTRERQQTYGNISTWNTSNITNMSEIFRSERSFNDDISGWDTSNVTNMSGMFEDATSFNQDISGWDTSNVSNMESMFEGATSFNQDISIWKTRNVTDMHSMFEEAISFNQDISGWDTRNASNMHSMFEGATSFNQDIGKPGNGWDTSNVTDMSYMFNGATNFNGDISDWDTSKVTHMDYMFKDATNFNQDISRWDTSKVSDMTKMFYNANSFTGCGGPCSGSSPNLTGWSVRERGGPINRDFGVGSSIPTRIRSPCSVVPRTRCRYYPYGPNFRPQ